MCAELKKASRTGIKDKEKCTGDRVSGFMHEDNYDTTLRKAVAPLLDN